MQNNEKMRIFDENNNEIAEPDLSIGYMMPDRMLTAHHEAVAAVDEVYHYEYTEFPSGGRERRKIVDVPAVDAVDAWDEYEDILRFVPFTQQEIRKRKIEENKYKLMQTDYITSKAMDSIFACTNATEFFVVLNRFREEYGEILQQRQAWRDEINELEAEE